ncbi:hypothetical protein F5Y09DRAFT_356753 [Xylaria sp. FL1042]|nr:hypothetical protein F5Y09DRAFT_356753 [Xylaria sp. FL1042]
MLPSFVLVIVTGFITGPAAAQSTTATSTSDIPQSTACGDIVNSSDIIFNASSIYECMISVPFNAAVASRFVAYYNDTLRFQSTLAYLKNPPPSYQQNSVDLVEGLARLQNNIDNGRYGSQYDFETDLMRLVYAAHDGHLNLAAGVFAAFSFSSPFEIVSVSIDGISPPKVYLADDLFNSEYFTSFQPSALQSINGIDTVSYLEQFAADNSPGTLEPHADWNQLMLSPAVDILGYLNVFFGGATFYPGDTITWTFENGTTQSDRFLGVYYSQGPTGPLETGGDFYNFFVLGFYPAGFDPYSSDDSTANGDDDDESDQTSSTSSEVPSLSTTVPQPAATSAPSWNNPAYPQTADVAQPDLGTVGGGYLSGYFLRDTSIAVLSIPSFDEYGEALNSFQSTIQQFLQSAREAGMTKVVIDVQQNTGGQPLLAIDAFQRFFPNLQPYSGSRMRAHDAANVMGTTDTDFWDGLDVTDYYYNELAANEWVVTDRINAETGQNFTSWTEFYGPNTYNGDSFSNVQLYNTSDMLFDYESTYETANLTIPAPVANASPPFAASDILILSDGICDSACALFVELMHHGAGVRTVAAGGLPKDGPMQTPSGSRGARIYDIFTLDDNINFVQLYLQYYDPSNANFLPNRTEANDLFILGATVNLRDQVRPGQITPLQFAYLPADCRIYFTPQTVYNYTNLWQYAANAIWTNTSLCVPGSTGYTDSMSAGPNGTSGSKNNTSTVDLLNGGASNQTALLPSLLQPDGLLDSARPISRQLKKTSKAKTCTPAGKGGSCDSGLACVQQRPCQTAALQYVCVPQCFSIDKTCVGTGDQKGTCRANGQIKLDSKTVTVGTCQVSPVDCPGILRTLFGPGPGA